MTDLSDYSLALLRRSTLLLHRGTSPTLGHALFVMPDASGQDGECARRLHHEYGLRAELPPQGALRPTALLRRDEGPVLVLEDFEGRLLREWCGEPMPVGRFVPLAIAISTALGAVHERCIVHCDLNPDNLFIADADGSVRLTGFGYALRNARQPCPIELRHANHGALEYMAPELCGQMKQRVDTRADLYSLGCTFYEMLTGSLPIAGHDRLALVHAHLARYPAPPSERVAGIPRQIEMIVMKLLAKDPEQRYQSAASLTVDLGRCAAMLHAGERIGPFPLDIPALRGRPCASPQLFGREEEKNLLDAAFSRCAQGTSAELILISGYSGSGKSSLINQWMACGEQPPHLFAAGTCEQVNSATPYTALSQILEQLVRPLLGQSEETFLASRRRLLEALGARARMLWSMVPDLQLILGDLAPGDEPAVPVDRKRFLNAAADLIKAFCTPESPLILFFDDLQWADEGTLSAFAHLATDASAAPLLLVGAYRSNEVQGDHPLRQFIARQGANLHQLHLSPLGRDDTARLVANALGCSFEQVSPVVDLIREKTGGNPFFATQFSIELAEEGLIEFEHKSTLLVRDIDRIRAKAYSDNVVDLMLRRFDRLGASTQFALRHFACLGSIATVPVLATSMSLAQSDAQADVHAALSEALGADLVYRHGDTYGFRHDRFREAAYRSMDESDRAAMHLEIGRRMVSTVTDDEACEEIFEIVSQINLAVDHLRSHATTDAEKRRFAALNIAAARRANGATAYASALTYLDAAATLLADLPDHDTDETAQWVEFWRADCECLLGRLAPAKQRLKALATRDVSMALGAEAARLAAGLHTAQNRPDLGIAAGLDFLRRLGIEIELRPTDAQVDEAYARFVERIGERPIATLATLPMVTDPLWHSVIGVLADMLPPALFIDVNLLDTILLQVGSLSLEHGLCDASAFGFVILNSVFGARYRDYGKAFEFGEVAISLIERCGASRYKSRVYMRFGTLVLPWSRPVREAKRYIEHAYRISTQIGNLVFDVFGARNAAGLLMLAGAPLEEVQREASKAIAIARTSNFALYLAEMTALLELISALRDGGLQRHESHAPGGKPSHGNLTTCVAFCQWCYRLQGAFFRGDREAMLEAEAMCRVSLQASTTILEVIDFRFYSALGRAAACAAAPGPAARASHLAALREHHAHLAVMAEDCPANFAGRHLLISAQIAHLEGDIPLAQQRYYEAIRHAEANGFRQVLAIANELAADFCAKHSLEQHAQVYLRAARNAYADWGADTKAAGLDRRCAHLANAQAIASVQANARRAEELAYQQLDMAAVIRMSNALASEIVLSRLIETLVTTALQHAGAQRCILALAHGASLRIEAEANVRPHSIEVQVASAELSSSQLATSIVQAAVRTGKHLVLDHACESGPFTRDEYVKRQRSRSILCTPLIKQTSLVGVLYMENDLAVGAFTADKSAVLAILGSQAAIALENARLYDDLLEQNRARAEAEEALRNTLADLARVTRLTTMGELVASIVHEVSQPLMAIQTSSGAALRWLDRDLPNVVEARDMITNVVADSMRASSVIQGLRAMVRQSEPTLAAFDLGTAIFEVLVMLRGQMQDHNVELVNQTGTPSLVKGDRVQVQQVVMNLVVNATESMSAIHDRPRLLTLTSTALNEHWIQVSVADNGPGLAPGVSERIFEPFVTTKKSGMGMGLSICRSIVEAHHGRLTVTAGEPFGTTFSFTLPAAPAP